MATKLARKRNEGFVLLDSSSVAPPFKNGAT